STIQDDFRILFYSGDLDLVCSAIHVSRGTTIIAQKNDLEEGSPSVWAYLGDFAGAQTSYSNLPGAPAEPAFPFYSGYLRVSEIKRSTTYSMISARRSVLIRQRRLSSSG
ncbi:hypothetical protein PENTCL1PPCAC_5167, partial [Pristionchus entomophagus]